MLKHIYIYQMYCLRCSTSFLPLCRCPQGSIVVHLDLVRPKGLVLCVGSTHVLVNLNVILFFNDAAIFVPRRVAVGQWGFDGLAAQMMIFGAPTRGCVIDVGSLWACSFPTLHGTHWYFIVARFLSERSIHSLMHCVVDSQIKVALFPPSHHYHHDDDQ